MQRRRQDRDAAREVGDREQGQTGRSQTLSIMKVRRHRRYECVFDGHVLPMFCSVNPEVVPIAKLINSAGIDAQFLRDSQNRRVGRRREAAAPRPRSYIPGSGEVVVASSDVYGNRRPR